MKKILFYITILITSTQLWAQSVTINEAKGWLETAFVKWAPVSGANSYNVYYTGGGQTNKKIDNQLIRKYGSYYRADLLGLSAGTYTIKVAPVVSGVEGTATTSSSVTVLAHDRSGFAFDSGRVPGAYNANGTPKANAVILYITETTKNTISLDVTGANSNPCVGLQTIFDGFKKGNDTRPLIVRLIGNITDLSFMYNGDIVVENDNNTSSYITLEGVGEDAVANGWGIRIKNASNVEIRNIAVMNCNSDEGDNIGLQQNDDHIWVHNCDLFYGDAGSDADQVKGDGALDCKKSNYVTFSYNHFWDTGKSNLLGLSEGTTANLYITYHHNWYDHSDSRHPRVRYYSAHLYNNYYDGNSKYGVGSTLGSSVFVEGNYFRNCKYPMMTSKQGTDIYYDSSGTFSGEAGGFIKSYNNTIIGETRFVTYNSSTYPVEFDAYAASSRNQTISSSIKSKLGANTYNNFDTNASLYVKNLVIDQPLAGRDKTIQYAGRVSGGDFKWTFNNAVDDTSSSVNTPLKNAIVNYTTSLVSVQDGTSSGGTTDPVDEATIMLNATAGNSLVNLNWTVANLNVTALEVYRDTDSNPSGRVRIATVSTSTLSYTDNSVTNGTTYYYWIKANGTLNSNAAVATPTGNGSGTSSNQIHNFTVSEKTSDFYNISGNMSSSNGSVSYNGLTLTRRLKIESSTSITFTTTGTATLTLVFDSSFTGNIKVNTISYTASGGIVTVPLTSGLNTITKDNTANLYYMSTIYPSSNRQTVEISKGKVENSIILYPNPVTNYLNITSSTKIDKVQIYTLTGVLIRSIESETEAVDMSTFKKGTYIIKIHTKQGITDQVILKE